MRIIKLICLALALTFFSAQATIFTNTTQFIVADGETIDEETWVFSDGVSIDGKMESDLFSASPSIKLNGIFQDDVWGAGDAIISDGNFYNDLRLLSRTTQFFGSVKGTAKIVAGTVKIGPEAVFEKEILCYGETVISEGSIDGDMSIWARKATLGGEIKGDVKISAAEIVVLPNTIIDGNLDYWSTKELILPPSVQLGGTFTHNEFSVGEDHLTKSKLITHYLFCLGAFFAGLIFLKLFPNYTNRTITNIKTSPGMCLLIGFSALFILPVAAVTLFLVLFVGWPASFLILASYGILLYLSRIIIGLLIGILILHRRELSRKAVVASLFVGLLIFYTALLIPLLGFIAQIAVSMFGLGALLLSIFRKKTPKILEQVEEEKEDHE